jgi:hypothetical protein
MHIASRDEPASGAHHGAPGRSVPGSLITGTIMNSHFYPTGELPRFRRFFRFVLVLSVLFAVSIVLAACSSSTGSATVEQAGREASFRQIAKDYATNGDLAAAETALDKMDLANPAQLIVSLAESDVSAGRPKQDIEPLARLAAALGARSPRLVAYLAPTALAPTPAVQAPVAAPTITAVPQSTAAPVTTPVPATATLVPTAAPTEVPPSATPPPQEPRVLAEGSVNLRSGPDRAYPVIGRLNAGQEVGIVGRNASGDWWRIEWAGNGQAWVAGTVVRVLGAIDTVAEVENIRRHPLRRPGRPHRRWSRKPQLRQRLPVQTSVLRLLGSGEFKRMAGGTTAPRSIAERSVSCG